MESILGYVLAGTRGGTNRARIRVALHERPRTANQLAEASELDSKAARHHFDVLTDNGVVESIGGDHGAVHRLTDQAQHNWDTITSIIAEVA